MAIENDVLETQLEEELAGLDALDALRTEAGPGLASRAWSALWPKVLALFGVFAVWQIVVWSHWKPEYALPGPTSVLPELGRQLKTVAFWHAVATTMRRALVGFGLAVAIGTLLGIGVSRSSILKRGFGSFLTGLQSMPSITWFPLAILLFKLSEGAILFVVVLGAAPSIANGLVSGVDHIPPLLLRAGKMLGARGVDSLRHVVLPAALPGYVAGLKQGWAFSWRSLLAGELLVDIAARSSIGAALNQARELNDATKLLAMMIVVFGIGVLIDGLVFSAVETRIRRRRGLIETGAAA